MTLLLLPGDWVDDAACGNHPHPEQWFRAGNATQLLPAKQVCAGCPVKTVCLAHAIRSHEQYGIWGGLTPKERVPLAHCAHCGKPAGGTNVGGEIIPRVFCTRTCQFAATKQAAAAAKKKTPPPPEGLMVSCFNPGCDRRFRQGGYDKIVLYCSPECRKNDPISWGLPPLEDDEMAESA